MNEQKEDLKLRGYTLVDERRPPPATPVMVVTEGSRCIGYIDHSGQWRYFRDDDLIGEVLAWRDCGTAALRAIGGLRRRSCDSNSK